MGNGDWVCTYGSFSGLRQGESTGESYTATPKLSEISLDITLWWGVRVLTGRS